MTTTMAAAAAELASEDLTIVDTKLFKAICLHQMLDPSHRGDRYRLAFRAVLCLSFGVQIMQLVGLYTAVNDLQRFAVTTMSMVYGVLGLCKGYVVVANADRLRAGLDVARFGFTSCGARDQRTVHRCRALLSTLLRTFTVLSWVTCVLWALAPLFMEGDYLSVTNTDGSVSRYRTNIVNVWVPVPASVYNWPPVWTLVYAVEVTVCSVNVFSWLLFDCYVITMCFTLNAQFRTVSASSAMIGHRDSFRSPPPHPSGTHDKKSDDNILNFYDELINHIQDNQNIIKRYSDFFKVLRPVILFQIIGGSYSIISLIFLTSLTYLMGGSILSTPVLKLICGFLSLTFEIFMYCKEFNHIETEKSSVNFRLYSCNWTELDLKFKKTLLLAMHMNSAHRLKMKVTPKSILNLEMFIKVMKMSYSIVSVLLNPKAGK